MKQMKFWTLTLLLLMGVSFSSCFDSDNGTDVDVLALVDVRHGYMGVGIELVSDDGYTFNIISAHNKYFEDNTGNIVVKRCNVALKLAEGVTLSEETKNYSNVQVVDKVEWGLNDLTVPEHFEVQKGAPFLDLYETASFTKYINLQFDANTGKDTNFDSFMLYVDKYENNTVYLKLHHDEEDKELYGQARVLYSFNAPRKSYLEEKFPDFQPLEGDSINVIVTADLAYETTKETKSFKAKLEY